MREQFSEYRVLNGPKLFRSKSEKAFWEINSTVKKFKKVVLDSLNAVLPTLAFLNCKSLNPFFSGFESEKKSFFFNQQKLLKRYLKLLRVQFWQLWWIFYRMSGKFLLHFERSHTNGIFSEKRNFQFFSRTVKTIFKQWLKLVDQNSENNRSIPKQMLDYDSSKKKDSKCSSGHAKEQLRIFPRAFRQKWESFKFRFQKSLLDSRFFIKITS